MKYIFTYSCLSVEISIIFGTKLDCTIDVHYVYVCHRKVILTFELSWFLYIFIIQNLYLQVKK